MRNVCVHQAQEALDESGSSEESITANSADAQRMWHLGHQLYLLNRTASSTLHDQKTSSSTAAEQPACCIDTSALRVWQCADDNIMGELDIVSSKSAANDCGADLKKLCKQLKISAVLMLASDPSTSNCTQVSCTHLVCWVTTIQQKNRAHSPVSRRCHQVHCCVCLNTSHLYVQG